MSNQGYARAICRIMLGTIFLMAGWYKCFTMGPVTHAEQLFTGPYVDTWIPQPLLWLTGVAIPVVELIAGGLLVIGLRTRASLLAIGAILLLVTYGHLLKEPFYGTNTHILPRTVLMVIVFLLPAESDRLSIDWFVSRSSSRATAAG